MRSWKKKTTCIAAPLPVRANHYCPSIAVIFSLAFSQDLAAYQSHDNVRYEHSMGIVYHYVRVSILFYGERVVSGRR